MIVRGEDQLHSFRGVLAELRSAVISGAGGFVDSDAVPAGQIWCVTGIFAYDVTSPTTAHRYVLRHDGANYNVEIQTAAFGAGVASNWKGWLWMDAEDVIRMGFTGAAAGDTCQVELIGYEMTLEV